MQHEIRQTGARDCTPLLYGAFSRLTLLIGLRLAPGKNSKKGTSSASSIAMRMRALGLVNFVL
jgi:hypothetical protein